MNKQWRVKTGTIDIINVEAETPMEAATLVVEQLHQDSKIESVNRLYNVGLLIECSDMKHARQDPDNHTFYVLASQVFANAGLHSLSRELEKLEKVDSKTKYRKKGNEKKRL